MKSADEIFAYVRAVLNLFKAVPALDEKNFPRKILDNEKNLADGFFITDRAFEACPCVADSKLLSFIKDKFGYNIFELNQGFYKSFETVANSTPQKILANKLLHYMSTYGFENLGIFDRELVYIPRDVLELPADAKPVKVTVIDAISDEEIITRTKKIIQSGAALSDETLDDIISVIKFLGIEVNADDVPNKELSVRLCELLNILPNDPVKFLRYMIYMTTSSTLLIKDDKTITALKNSASKFSGYYFDQFFSRYIDANGLGKLASVFHRFKPLWLAFKPHSNYLRTTINRMRKLADHYHKPAPPKFLEQLTACAAVDVDKLKRELANITTYKKISLANAILYRQAAPQRIIYNIRNGKAFADDYRGNLNFDAQEILDVIINSIVEDISANVSGKKIFIPENFSYGAPVSEKNFVGNIPSGSSYTFGKKSVVVGVHWFNLVEGGEEVRVDLDLHFNSKKIDLGWHNDFNEENFINTKERKIIFSGDMTDAPIAGGGATEAVFVGESLTDEVITVNLNHYNHYADSKPVPFKLVLADVAQEKIDRQYLLDAHEISYCVPGELSSGEMFLGCLTSNDLGEKKFYFFSRDMGNRIVARSGEMTDKIASAMRTTFETFLTLNEVLQKAGAVLEGVTADDCDINLDPAEVTKDILLGLID
ncbi:MAG: hypothetical protein IJS69_06755 [Selenomonadaceae bacterium]|nr:hypothetical protein [Selenomonadaceae bacterium]